MDSKTENKLDLMEIGTQGTKYFSVVFDPNTWEVITMLKQSRSNGISLPHKEPFNNFCNSIPIDQQMQSDMVKSKITIMKRIKKAIK